MTHLKGLFFISDPLFAPETVLTAFTAAYYTIHFMRVFYDFFSAYIFIQSLYLSASTIILSARVMTLKKEYDRTLYMNWHQELKNSISLEHELEKLLPLHPKEKAWFQKIKENRESAYLPFRVPRRVIPLIGEGLNDPIRRQIIPRIDEFTFLSYESRDPLCEANYSPLPALIHRYDDRVLFLASKSCSMYCRHCFRRHHTSQTSISRTDLLEHALAASEYIAAHPRVQELLISGGDPLMLENDSLAELLSLFRSRNPGLIIRIGTRIPIMLPSRIDQALLRLLHDMQPLYLVLQCNHPRELNEEVRDTLRSVRDHGLGLLNQSVFLRGVNNSSKTLRLLSAELLRCGVLPYYLFQGDLAAGTSHLRAPLSQGLSIMRSLRQSMSGMATPLYAVDLPSGGGKSPIPLEPVPQQRNGFFIFTGPDAKTYYYPDER